MDQGSEPVERFSGSLARAERSSLAIKNYRGDLGARPAHEDFPAF
jgi:hypothetical protein